MSRLNWQSITALWGSVENHALPASLADSPIDSPIINNLETSSQSDSIEPPILPAHRIVGTNGNDQLVGLPGDNIFEPQFGFDRVAGGAGIDTLILNYSGQSGVVRGGGASGVVTRSTLNGSLIDRVLYTSIDRFEIQGTDQNDDLQGGADQDILSGNGGDDRLEGNAGADRLMGGEGIDTASYRNSASGVAIDLMAGTAAGGDAAGDQLDSIENLIGSNFADRLQGDDRDNAITPLLAFAATDQPGVDVVDGGAGIDLLILDYTDAVSESGLDYLDGTYSLTLQGQLQQVRYANFERFQITGTAQSDRIVGGAGSDRLVGGAGNDLITGGGGSDTILGGAGNDAIVSLPANSNSDESTPVILDGGAGVDTLSVDLSSQTQNIVLDTRLTNPFLLLADGTRIQNFEVLATIKTGSGNDTIVQIGRVDNLIQTGAGNDIVNPGASVAIDQVDGGAGNDTLVLDYSQETISRLRVEGTTYILENQAQSTSSSVQSIHFETVNITGTPNDDLILGTSGDDTLVGGNGDDTLNGLGGSDNIDAGSGDDTVIAVRSPDADRSSDAILILNGGAGRDTLSVDLSQKESRIVFDSTSSQVIQLADGTSIVSFEILKDIWTGSGSDRLVQTGFVDNQWDAGAGNDFLNPGWGSDTIDGGAGIDTLFLDYSSLDGTIESLPKDSAFRIFRVTNSAGQMLSQVSYANIEQITVVGTANDDSISGGAGEDTLQGEAGDDRLDGNAGDDMLTGDQGNDQISGGEGIDRLIEAGNVNFVATDAVLTGLGIDRIFEIEQLHLTGGQSDNVIDTSAFSLGSAMLFGLGGDDTLLGGAGDDSFTGGLGDDIIRGGDGDDLLVESGNVNFRMSNRVLVGVGRDSLESIEEVRLVGGAGANRMDASAATNIVTLVGGAGNDTLLGAANLGSQTLSQFASSIIAFSSQAGSGARGARQVLGAPNVDDYGDSPLAWAPAARNNTTEFITVGFAIPVFATGATIRQTWGSGFVRRIEVLEEDNTYTRVWQGSDPSAAGEIANFRADWAPISNLVKGLRISIDTDQNFDTWEEIDSIQLHGVSPTSGDRLEGGTGNDTLIGNSGNDILVGGAGIDRFLYRSMADDSDIIMDFSAASDILDLQSLMNNLDYTGRSAIADGYMRLIQIGANTQVQIDADGRGRANSFTTLVTLNNVNRTDLVIGDNLLI